MSPPSRTLRERLDPWRAAALHAALGREGPPPAAGDPLPQLAHWLHFLEAAPAAALGRDGHPAKGDFIPDLGLSRRMWAGGRVEFRAPLRLGAEAKRVSTVAAVERKDGRTGLLGFVTLRHEISGPAGLALVERQDLVYREDPKPGAPAAAQAAAPKEFSRERRCAFGPVPLFRYSALTFNGHRIHYDRDYARGVEGYPGLVVHGPLLAQILLDLAAERLGPVAIFEYRARNPGFDFEELAFRAEDGPGGCRLWAAGPDGRLLMEARAEA